MQLNVTTLVYWKKDHNAETNEDALDLDIERGLYVVCDGVGEASFSNEWAPVLARSFIERPLFSEDPFELEHWTRAAQTDARPRMTDPETLSGVARDKARRGAAATLCGMVLVPRQERDGIHYGYNLTAIGDSNFFHWRPDPSRGGAYKLLFAFPLKKYSDFNSSPDSLNSRSHNRDNVAAHTFSSTPELELRQGDVLFLATDAVSQWIFREYEATLADEGTRRHPAPPILEIAAQHDTQPNIEVIGSPWANLIDTLREGNDIVDDDSIMIILRVLSTSRGGDIRSTDPEPRIKERTKELLSVVSKWLMRGVENSKSDVDIAVAFGDGGYIDPAIRARLGASARFRVMGSDAGSFRASHIELWRANADTYKRVTDGVRAVMRDDADPRQHEESKRLLEETWREVREQLVGLTWMQGLITTLQGMGIEQPESNADRREDIQSAHTTGDPGVRVLGDGRPAPDPKVVSEGTGQVYKAIGDWVTGRGSEAAIVKAFDSNPHLDPAFAAAITTPIGVHGGMVSHMDIWRARAAGGDAPTPVPPRKKAKARPVVSDALDDTAPKVPLPPRPGITSASPLPSSPPGEAPKPPAPRQPHPPPTPPTTSSGASESPEPSPPTPSRQSYSTSMQRAAVGQMAAPIPYPYSAKASSRSLLWAVGGAALLGSIILVVALVWVFSSQQPAPALPTPVPGTATVTRTPGTPATATVTATPNRTATALSVGGGNSTAVPTPIPTSTPARATDTPLPTSATPTWTAGTAPRPAQPTATIVPTPAASYLRELTMGGWLPASKSIYFVLHLSYR
ncbi:MAG TPA: hypothetical protein VJ183_11285 [Chloroflexia bacterium]|nr:hypothetical protein [Chloroflexia bacterium]